MKKTFGIKNDYIEYKNRYGAYAIIINQDKIGIIESDKGLFLVGGEKLLGESNEDCIKRECLEETGYHLEIINFICSADAYLNIDDLGYFHMNQSYYLAKLLEHVQESSEISHHFKWLPIRQAQMKVAMQDWAVKYFLAQMNQI
ncbi:MAG: NUDIX domain-containing protein [Acholeplasmataceae bacterium]|nr:NUDIX domain-containing protein [Acholeplasmataceae bacterium]